MSIVIGLATREESLSAFLLGRVVTVAGELGALNFQSTHPDTETNATGAVTRTLVIVAILSIRFKQRSLYE